MTTSSENDDNLKLLQKLKEENLCLRRENERLSNKLKSSRDYAEDLRRQVEQIGSQLSNKSNLSAKHTQTEDQGLILNNGSTIDTKWTDSESKSIVEEVKEIAALEAKRQFLGPCCQ